MSSFTDTLDRLASARPRVPRPDDVLGPGERDRLLRSITASPPERLRVGHPVRSGIAMAAAVSVAIVGLASLTASDADRQPRTSPSDESVATGTLERIKLAVSRAEGGVVHVRSDFGNGVLWETWLDDDSGRWRSASSTPDGRLLYEHQVDGDNGTVIVVSHTERAWWSYQAPEMRGQAKLFLTPEEIRARLNEGSLEQAGEETTGGRRLLRLRGAAQEKAAGVYTAAIDLWVDGETYLPARYVASTPNGSTMSAAYEWLPASDDNVAQATLVVPPEYRRLTQPSDAPPSS